jgi:hypothetical protein
MRCRIVASLIARCFHPPPVDDSNVKASEPAATNGTPVDHARRPRDPGPGRENEARLKKLCRGL